MSAAKALTMNATLVQKVTDAALEALKAGMTKEEVAAVLARIQEVIESSDD
ncbi:MAG: hypothetical protein ACXWN0_10585 [Isosphaeraceae bacterium]